jgi:tetratricopeptide (TPR) repeat protein
VKVLHLDLKQVAGNYVELRYFVDNPNQYQPRSLPLEQIADLLNQAEKDYYVRLAVEYTITGQHLYNWLDGSDRFLQGLINQYRDEGIILAIATAENLAHLPWEVLHDRNGFLVQRGIVPVRWLSSETVKRLSVEEKPENRALQVLFMATSPLGVEPVLDFEAEEARILTATARQPLALTVEESGCLSELGYLVDVYGKGYFDVLHLTGHATIQDTKPYFITESETGEPNYASASDIAQELRFRLPKLIFLSGCRTGQAGNAGAVPSLAQELLNEGATAVLGWGQKVLDTDATAAAAALYQELAAGKQVAEAVACTYQALIKNKARDWHLLRLYVKGTLPGELVTTLRTRGRKPAPPPSVATQFLDTAGKVKVCTRESFVGRRRQLQSCLRALTTPPSSDTERVGVLIHGMGGLGKSSLAARLCDRLAHFQRVVIVGRIDEPLLVSRLAEKLDSKELRETLQRDDEELKFRLRRVFGELTAQGANPFLLVLDDFEVNLEPRNDGYVLQPEAATVLQALVWAIRDISAPDRLILTCRYDFESTPLQYFYKQPLEALRGADLRKKCDSLAAFSTKSVVDEALQAQAKRLADGNPRLLEWLDKILQNSTVDKVAILNSLEVDSVELREQVLAKALLQQMDDGMREMLSRGLVFELPVPREALTAVCDLLNLDKYIDRAVALGLLEVSHDQSLRVPRILPVELFDATSLFVQAAQVLYRLWWEETNKRCTEEQGLEIVRLGLLAEEQEIAVSVGDLIANYWVNSSRNMEAVQLGSQLLQNFGDYRILGTIARAEEVLGRVEDAVAHYQQSLDFCPEADLQRKAATLGNMAGVIAQQGDIQGAIALWEQSLEILERIGDVRGKAVTLGNMAQVIAQQGDIQRAIALRQQSLELYERIGDVGGKAATLGNMAQVIAQQGDIQRAIALRQQSLELYERIGDVGGKAATLGNMAQVIAQQGDIQRAIALRQQSLELYERIGDVGGKAATLNNMALLIAQQGDIQRAIALWEQSLEIIERIGDVGGKAVTLNNMAQVIAQQGDIQRAIALWEQSLELYERIGDVGGKAATLNNMAQVIAQQGDIERAIALRQQSLELYERIGDVGGKAATLNNMAQVIAQQGDIERAIALRQQSLELYERIGDVGGKAATLNNMAQVIAQQGDIERAIALRQQSLELYERIGDVRGKAATLGNMAGVIAQQGDIERAIALWEQSLEILERIGDVGGKAATLNNMAGVIAQQGDIERAIALWEQSLELDERIGDVRGKAATLNNMAGVIAQQGDIERAIALWEQSLELDERIGDVGGKAATLNNMAGVIAQQGDIERAIALWEQSLELDERIGDVRGKAVTLANLASWAGETGDKARQLDLNLQAASALAQVRAYGNLVTVLSNLGVADESNGLVYLAQAIWLRLRIQAPLANTIQIIRAFYNAVPQGDELEALLGITARFFCSRQGEGHPQLEELQELSLTIISAAAGAQGIETPEAFDTWVVQQRLNNPEYFIPRLTQRLEEIVGDEWLFDRSQV